MVDTQISMSYLKPLNTDIMLYRLFLNRSVVSKSQRVSISNPPTPSLVLQNVRVFLYVFLSPPTFRFTWKNMPRMSRECAAGMITIASNSWPSSVTSLERFNSHSRTLANSDGCGGVEVSWCWLVEVLFGESLPFWALNSTGSGSQENLSFTGR